MITPSDDILETVWKLCRKVQRQHLFLFRLFSLYILMISNYYLITVV